MTLISKNVYIDKLDDIELINIIIHTIAQLKWKLLMKTKHIYWI